MTTLLTAPLQVTTLSSSATFDAATISYNSSLVVTGANTLVTIAGVTSGTAGTVVVSDGATLRLGSTITGPVMLTGSGATVEFDGANGGAELVSLAQSTPSYAANATVVLHASATSLFGLAPGDKIEFASPAVSFTYDPIRTGGLGKYPVGTLSVLEQDGSTVTVGLQDSSFGFNHVNTIYDATTFAVVNGAIIYKTYVAPSPLAVTGVIPNQAVYATQTVQPLSSIVITDPNAGQTDTVSVVQSLNIGTLQDPNAASDGSSYDPGTATYTVAGSAAAVTQALNALVFTPNSYFLQPGQSVATQLRIRVTDGVTAATETSSTVVIAASTAVTAQLANGASGAGTITNNPAPAFSGVAPSGAAVTLLANGAALGSTSASGTGAWTATPATALGVGAQQVTAASPVGRASALSAPVNLFELPAPAGGVTTADFSSLDLGTLLGAGYTMQFVAGTEAVVLVNGTLSVGPDTNEAYVQRLYVGLLGRPGDTPGLAGLDQSLGGGVSQTAVAAAFLSSAEYQALHGAPGGVAPAQFVTSLYQGLLGRAPDQAGLDGWTTALQQGTSQAQVAAAIAQSAESKAHLAGGTAHVWAPNPQGALVTAFYETALGRVPDLPGLQHFVGELQAGGTAAGLAQDFAASGEFQAAHAGQDAAAYVGSLYQAGFGRAPDAAGLQGWVGALQSGTSQAGVLLAFTTSPEAQAHLLPNL